MDRAGAAGHPAARPRACAEAAGAHHQERRLRGQGRQDLRGGDRRLRRAARGPAQHLDQRADQEPLSRSVRARSLPHDRGLARGRAGRRPLWRASRPCIFRREHVLKSARREQNRPRLSHRAAQIWRLHPARHAVRHRTSLPVRRDRGQPRRISAFARGRVRRRLGPRQRRGRRGRLFRRRGRRRRRGRGCRSRARLPRAGPSRCCPRASRLPASCSS